MTTIRSLIRDIQAEVRGDDLQPDRAADLVAKLSSLYGNTVDQVRVTELVVNDLQRTYILQGSAVNKAEALAKATPEYAAYREAKDLEKTCLQMISSLKAMLRMKSEEMRMTR